MEKNFNIAYYFQQREGFNFVVNVILLTRLFNDIILMILCDLDFDLVKNVNTTHEQ